MKASDAVTLVFLAMSIAFLLIRLITTLSFGAIAHECETFGATEIRGTVYECRAVRDVR